MNQLWQRIADFLHRANLIPLVVIVSAYHYFQALRSHDPLLVAIPIALFVDLLHFRTVQRAVRVNQMAWKFTAVLTTAIAFGLQWIFYSQPTNEAVLPTWQAVLFASIVPVGLAIMAWHHESRARDVAVDWQTEIEAAQERADRTQEELSIAQKQAQKALAEMHEAQQANDWLKTELEAARAELESALDAAAASQAEVRDLQVALDEAQPILRAWEAMNQRVKVAAQVHVGQLDMREGAAIIGMSVDTVRRDVARLNGNR